MKHEKIRIFINSIVVIFILLSKIIIRRKRRIIYFDPQTGWAKYKITYYTFLFIPVWRRIKVIPK